MEERRDVALLLLTCRRKLLRHQVVVYGSVDVSEDPDRSGVRSGLSQTTERERRARLGVMRVVYKELRLIGHVDDLDAAVRTLPDALLIFLTEANRLPVLEVDPVRLVLADEVERAVVVDVAVLEDLDERRALVLRRAAQHKGTAFIEIFQNCNIYNDGAFDFVREDKTNRIYLEHGQPIRFGEENEKGVRQRADGSVEIVDVTDEAELLVHDTHHAEPSAAFALSRLTQSTSNATPIGIFRDVDRPVYDDLMSEQLATAREKQEGDIAALLQAGDTWTI